MKCTTCVYNWHKNYNERQNRRLWDFCNALQITAKPVINFVWDGCRFSSLSRKWSSTKRFFFAISISRFIRRGLRSAKVHISMSLSGVCVCVRECVHMWLCLFLCVYDYDYVTVFAIMTMWLCLRLWLCLCLRLWLCLCLCLCDCTRAYVFVSMGIWLWLCDCVCDYVSRLVSTRVWLSVWECVCDYASGAVTICVCESTNPHFYLRTSGFLGTSRGHIGLYMTNFCSAIDIYTQGRPRHVWFSFPGVSCHLFA